jgi:hypothetical protein
MFYAGEIDNKIFAAFFDKFMYLFAQFVLLRLKEKVPLQMYNADTSTVSNL